MELDEAIKTYLAGYAGVSALVADRIYPDVLPQNCGYPALTYQQISEEEVESFRTPTSNLIGPTYQFGCWAKTRAAANALAKQLRLAYKNYSGVMGGAGGITVSAVEKIGRTTAFFTDSNGSVLAFVTNLDFQIWYQE